jgi:hypothetical protein
MSFTCKFDRLTIIAQRC